MSRATPQTRDLARQLLAYEMRGKKASEQNYQPAVLVCEKLSPVLATLMGNGGFRGLLARAVVLAREEAPWLHGVQVTATASLEGFAAATAGLEAKKVADGGVALIAQLLGLLNAFIGQDLTVRFVREAWPKFSFDDPNFDSGGKK